MPQGRASYSPSLSLLKTFLTKTNTMQRNECKPGTEVIIRGTIKEDDGTNIIPILVTIHDNEHEEKIFFEPSSLEPVAPKYDPKREFRKGDIVRFVGRGRKNYLLSPDNMEEFTVLEDERHEQVLVKCCEYTASFHFADLELIKPIEEIKAAPRILECLKRQLAGVSWR